MNKENRRPGRKQSQLRSMYDPVRQLAFYGIEYNEFEFRPKSNLGYY